MCLDPPLTELPQGFWKCPMCVVCKSCGTTSEKKWAHDYSLCLPCAEKVDKGICCPSCKRAYKGKESDDCSKFMCESCVEKSKPKKGRPPKKKRKTSNEK